MTTTDATPPANDRELVLTRIIDVPREKLYRAWTEPELLKQWFAPKPFTVPVAEVDVRPGGSSLIVMRDAEGNDYPNSGIFLEVVPNEKIVTTDAYTEAWAPSEKPFMTAIVTFEDLGEGRTKYVARARHWTVEDRETHEQMGFMEGWGICADQMADVARKL
ncbi:MAG TPA: SRPBCC family protein [Phenylobacterium sp.]|nr:SRPBCC family protein [Phenylobacterium sp.]